MSVFELRYLVVVHKEKSARAAEFVVAQDYETVLQYFRDTVSGESVTFEAITCVCPVTRILS